jgi:hypothetical protein
MDVVLFELRYSRRTESECARQSTIHRFAAALSPRRFRKLQRTIDCIFRRRLEPLERARACVLAVSRRRSRALAVLHMRVVRGCSEFAHARCAQ